MEMTPDGRKIIHQEFFILKKGRKKMKRPLAYISASWTEDKRENEETASKYCRQIFETGYNPICPILLLASFVDESIPAELKAAQDIALDYLRRSNILVVCGSRINESVKSDIANAERYRIPATTLKGIQTVKSHGQRDSK